MLKISLPDAYGKKILSKLLSMNSKLRETCLLCVHLALRAVPASANIFPSLPYVLF
jgi:hypothetical protein